MPRKQLDILKDLFVAYRDERNDLFLQTAEEYVHYLDWKKFGFKAREFENIINQIKRKNIEETFQEPFGDKNIERTLFGEVIEKEYPKAGKSTHVWQISRGAQVDFIQASVLLEYCINSKKKQFSSSEYPPVIGYSVEKSEGFSRILYFLGLLDDKSKAPSKLAHLIIQYDKYFEDIGTLWFLHYFISSDVRLIIWNRIVNFLFIKQSFTYEDTLSLLEDQRQHHSNLSFSQHLRKEFNTCIKAYTESNFLKLNLLSIDTLSSIYRKSQPYLVPDEILLSAIWLYKKRFYPAEVTIEIKSIVNADNSPGKLFYLNERYLRMHSDRLRVKGYITIESLADLDQIKFPIFNDYMDVLTIYYQQNSPEMPINLKSLIVKLKTERFNSCIIYGTAGSGKSKYIQQFIEKNSDLNIVYYSFLDEYHRVRSHQPLFNFTPNKFKTWSLSLIGDSDIPIYDALFIDNFDFLINLWSASEKEEFLKQVEKNIESSMIQTPVLFVVHTDPVFDNHLDKGSIISFSELETQNIF